MMARSDTLLHSEAEYIDARPLNPNRRNFLQRTVGPYIDVKFASKMLQFKFTDDKERIVSALTAAGLP